MVSFSCETCNDTLVKKKLDAHLQRCGGPFTCLDCNQTFAGTSYRSHTSCITEDQKYQGALYRPKDKKANNTKGQSKPETKPAAGTQEPSEAEKGAEELVALTNGTKTIDPIPVTTVDNTKDKSEEVTKPKENKKGKKEKKEKTKSGKKRKVEEEPAEEAVQEDMKKVFEDTKPGALEDDPTAPANLEVDATAATSDLTAEPTAHQRKRQKKKEKQQGKQKDEVKEDVVMEDATAQTVAEEKNDSPMETATTIGEAQPEEKKKKQRGAKKGKKSKGDKEETEDKSTSNGVSEDAASIQQNGQNESEKLPNGTSDKPSTNSAKDESVKSKKDKKTKETSEKDSKDAAESVGVLEKHFKSKKASKKAVNLESIFSALSDADKASLLKRISVQKDASGDGKFVLNYA